MSEEDVEGTYCTDFWNYPMFRSISESMNRKVPVGTLGLYIDKEAKLLQHFPCEEYSTPQWFRMVMHSHCAVLDGKEDVQMIVQPIDNLWEIAEYPEVKVFAKALVEEVH